MSSIGGAGCLQSTARPINYLNWAIAAQVGGMESPAAESLHWSAPCRRVGTAGEVVRDTSPTSCSPVHSPNYHLCFVDYNALNELPQLLSGKESTCNEETCIQPLGWEDPLEEEMAIHSSFLAWEIPWTEEPGRLQPVGLQRVRHGWLSTHTMACMWQETPPSLVSTPQNDLSSLVWLQLHAALHSHHSASPEPSLCFGERLWSTVQFFLPL